MNFRFEYKIFSSVLIFEISNSHSYHKWSEKRRMTSLKVFHLKEYESVGSCVAFISI